jgi:hypothetical protein
MAKIYYQQKQQILGGFAISTSSNTSVTTSDSWSIPVTSNTSVIRVYSENYPCLLKYNTPASEESWDYIIPAFNVLDLYNFSDVTSLNIIGVSGSPSVRIAQY